MRSRASRHTATILQFNPNRPRAKREPQPAAPLTTRPLPEHWDWEIANGVADLYAIRQTDYDKFRVALICLRDILQDLAGVNERSRQRNDGGAK